MMPELPEVETVRRGIAPHVTGQMVTQVIVRQPRLRWPVSESLATMWPGRIIQCVDRRAKYLLLRTEVGTAIFHLGMTGRLRILSADTPAGKHDHVDVRLANGQCLRFNDSRRFGAVLWTAEPPEQHPLLQTLSRTVRRDVLRSLASPAGARTDTGSEALHHGSPHRGRRGQHLR
jgi:formamidopyrimidine-DNA glycosylase